MDSERRVGEKVWAEYDFDKDRYNVRQLETPTHALLEEKVAELETRIKRMEESFAETVKSLVEALDKERGD